jgi:hypothetical protein
VLLTGANGLYRYDLNDVVEVRGCHERTPRVAFVRKGRDMLSITGEKLHLDHVLHVVRARLPARDRGWTARSPAQVERAPVGVDDVSRTEVVHRSAARELGGPVS